MNGSQFATSKIVQWLGVGALALALVVFGGGAWLGHAGPAFAPEPARLDSNLGSTNGQTGAARFVYSNAPTTVVKWSGSSFMKNNNLVAGQPCTTTGAPAGYQTSKVLHESSPNSHYFICF